MEDWEGPVRRYLQRTYYVHYKYLKLRPKQIHSWYYSMLNSGYSVASQATHMLLGSRWRRHRSASFIVSLRDRRNFSLFGNPCGKNRFEKLVEALDDLSLIDFLTPRRIKCKNALAVCFLFKNFVSSFGFHYSCSAALYQAVVSNRLSTFTSKNWCRDSTALCRYYKFS